MKEQAEDKGAAAFMLAVGRVISSQRKLRGLYQEELAKRAGININTLSRCENGATGNLETWFKVTRALGVELHEVFRLAAEMQRMPERAN